MTDQPERESMEYDVVIVGGGPSGLSAAIRLKQVNPELSVVLLEKGSEVGAHICSRAPLVEMLSQAKAAIAKHQPEAIVTLGGDCLVDLAPIAYLNERYGDDLAILWIDSHPDISTAEQMPQSHAHVLGMLMGYGDEAFVSAVPKKVRADQVLYIGLTEITPFEEGFVTDQKMARLSPEDLAETIEPVMDWVRKSGAKKIAVHFDLDVLDPWLHDFLLFQDPNAKTGHWDPVNKVRMRFEQVANILRRVNDEAEIVGLAIAEYMPWSAINLSKALRTLPLLGAK